MLFFCAVGMTMIIYSPYVLSNALIGLICLSLFDVQLKPFRFGWHPDLLSNWKGFWRAPAFWMTSLIFFAVLLTCLYSSDMQYGLQRLRLKIPFLVMPFVFFALPRLSRRAYQGLFYFLIIILGLTNLGIGANYLLHYEEVNALIVQGHHIPTPRNHIRYSLLLALGVLFGLVLFFKKFHLRYSWERWLILAITIFNFVFIHILSVRSGIAVLYATLMIGVVLFSFSSKKYLLGIISLSGIVMLPVIAFLTIPSFTSKVNYANWELHEFLEGRSVAGSDQGRIASYRVGWEVFCQQPVFGVGAGDLRSAVHSQYTSRFPAQTKKLMPHNQFLFVAAGMGFVGLLIFLLALCYPFFVHGHFRDPFYFIFFFVFFLSFLVEHTLENSIGIGFYVLFLGICLNYLAGQGKGIKA